MPRGRILVAEDEEAVRVTLGALLSDRGYEVTLASAAADALLHVQRTEFDLVLTDLCLGDGDGMRILEELRARWPETVGLVLTGYASIESAVEALRKGAYDYLCKPCPPDELLGTVARGLERRELSRQVRQNMRDLQTVIDSARELHSALSTRVEGTTALLHEREQVLASICSDLKKSLGVISALLQLLLGRLHGQPSEEALKMQVQELVDYLEQIRAETDSLVHRVNAALQLMREDSVSITTTRPSFELLEVSG
jgi:DNA-binding response OmpR family regulator